VIRAPSYVPAFVPVKAYGERFSAPAGPTLAGAIGRALVDDSDPASRPTVLRSVLQAVSDETAGRARALQDRATLAQLVDAHAALQGGAAVAAQPAALDQVQRIAADGQAALGSPGMVDAYTLRMGPALDDAAAQITGHALRQSDVERQAVSAQEMRVAQQGTASDWGNPPRFAAGLDAIHALATAQTDPQASDDDRAEAARAAVGGAVAGAVGQALSAGEPDFAAHILGAWGHTLTPAAYQATVAQLGDVAQGRRMATVIAQAAGGNPAAPSPDATPPQPDSASVAIPAPVGAAIYPVAGGTVTALSGTDGDHAVHIAHPDGSGTVIAGLGQPAVAPGDIVAPAHVIGSAGPAVTLSTTTPDGAIGDAATLVRSAGGPAALVGSTTTPRNWDGPAIYDRIAQREDLSPEDRLMARNLAEQRVNADQAQLAAGDTAAGRSVVALIAATPGGVPSVAALPADVTARMDPTTLAQVDQALRSAAQASTAPAPDNELGLRLALMQRQSPDAFAQVNLAPLIDRVHPTTLAGLASAQAGAEPPTASPDDPRANILDSLARHEVISGTTLPDTALPTILDRAGTLLRLAPAGAGDPAAIDGAVANAIQNTIPPN
jgi:murein DD-endopeptidase MepM/ murein hydrolase activator NlpD